jgi:tetratricopeptide (TPR) repeat protein
VANSKDYQAILYLLSHHQRVDDVLNFLDAAVKHDVKIPQEVISHIGEILCTDADRTEIFYNMIKERNSTNIYHWYISLLSACAMDDMKSAFLIYSELTEENLPLSEHCYNSLIEMSIRLRKHEQTGILLQEMKRRSIPYTSKTYLFAIDSLIFQGKIDEAEKVLDEALNDKNVPVERLWFVGLKRYNRKDQQYVERLNGIMALHHLTRKKGLERPYIY